VTLTPQWLDELRARTTLSTLIGRTLKITKAGREYKACCPFHNEKSPSFYVNDDKGFYHCFGCSAHGDAIRWLTDQRGLPFMDAVKELADAAGMEVPAADPRDVARAERANSLYDVMTAAAEWFSQQLQGIEGAEARTYLERRGISAATIKTFGMGFAPDSRGKLKTALTRFGDEALVESGLLIKVDDKDSYDRFRGRLIIPIRDPRSRVIAFGGRILGAGEPKYLNSPDTPLFDKGRTLYNLDLAAPASRKSNRILVVEGYMDVIALAQAGLADAVAPLGTALTEAQLERLWRQAEVPILCFDGDNAGQKASTRAALRALPMLEPGRSLAFLTLPPGQDPDDLVRSGGAGAMEALLREPEPLVDRLWRAERDASPLRTPEERAGLRRRLTEHAQAITNPDVRAQYLAEFRGRFEGQFLNRKPKARGQSRAPKSNRRYFEAPVSARARGIGGGGIAPIYARAIMAGLLRHPTLLSTCGEALSGLIIDDQELDRLRFVLIDAACSGEVLDSQNILPICAESGLAGLAEQLVSANGLAFSFAKAQAEPEVARRDLAMAIETLAARPHLDSALADATARLSEDWDENGFAEQMRLRSALDDVNRKLAALASGDDDDI
jgi:DNA primase